MIGKLTYKIIKHPPEEELDKKIKKQKDIRVLKRVYFIRHLYRGTGVKKTAEK